MRLGQVLEHYRRITGQTQRGLAEEIGVTHPTYARMESGEAVHSQTLGRILVWLFGDAPRRDGKPD